MPKDSMRIEWWDIDRVIPYENNPRHNDDAVEKVANSLKAFGWKQPMVVDADGVLIVGHTRLKAAKSLGMDKVPVLVANDLTPAQVQAYRIADNASGEIATWDFDLLAVEVDGLQVEFYMEDFGVDMSKLDFDIEGSASKDIVEDEVPEDAPSIVQRGDVWQLGRHRLMCGDSTDPADIDRLMDGVKADMVFTDPPYGNGDSGKYGRGQLGVRTILNDKNLNCFNDFVSIMSCSKIVYFLQWRTLCESLKNIEQKGLKINTVGVWDKKNAGLNGGGGISEQWEAIIFAGDIKYKKFGGNVFTVAREQHKRSESLHPHIKPQELLKQIFDFIDGGNVILDPFGGSGSTLIACEQLGRTCYMMELDPHYCDVIIERWQNLTGETAQLVLKGE